MPHNFRIYSPKIIINMLIAHFYTKFQALNNELWKCLKLPSIFQHECRKSQSNYPRNKSLVVRGECQNGGTRKRSTPNSLKYKHFLPPDTRTYISAPSSLTFCRV